MSSTDLKWSVYVKDTTPVAANDTIVLYSVPASDLLVATWKVGLSSTSAAEFLMDEIMNDVFLFVMVRFVYPG